MLEEQIRRQRALILESRGERNTDHEEIRNYKGPSYNENGGYGVINTDAARRQKWNNEGHQEVISESEVLNYQ
jgi:hypothetical protein